MELEQIEIPSSNTFASKYFHQDKHVMSFFHYDWTKEETYVERLNDLRQRSFSRDMLVQCIQRYMQKFPMSDQVHKSLEKLAQPDSVVVVGGQQAGLLTGPLYTIHKIFSILHLAKQKEEQLGVPVVPLFWIAGEDHDFLEVNHIFVENGMKLEKINFTVQPLPKQMISHLSLNKEELKDWVEDVFRLLGETSYTTELMNLVFEAIESTETMTEFFSYIIMKLFRAYGLLIIDSAYEPLREMERAFFKALIQNERQITKHVLARQQQMKANGWSPLIEINDTSTNLFYYDGQERLLLEFDPQTERFHSKHHEVSFTLDQLLQQVEITPQQFSNNVVSRPLMQEWLFPTLAFIAGPGEITYWGELGQAFEHLGFKMPPIVPRLHITYVERSIERDMKELGLTLSSVIQHGVGKEKECYLASIQDEEVNQLIRETSRWLEQQYEKIMEKGHSIEKGLTPIIDKNLRFHQNQLYYLQQKMQERQQLKHQHQINQYNRVQQHIKPFDSYQERSWNIFYYLNKYGVDFIDQSLNLPYSFQCPHHLIRI
ncbi:bacillithiol biosynthesis cysteine-adding enzyme BshC [Aeribacillus pallidus]|uniref:bacillithiol biosynthesis cysteine-adding enzyme BshC n=1 Tax=Aeribacillus pallidus TaxID=33936 RepID=UPI003D1B9B58